VSCFAFLVGKKEPYNIAGALRTSGAAVGPLENKAFLKYDVNDAQLYDPYTDNPSTNGFMRLNSEVLFDVIPKFLRDGWQVVRHFLPLP
jgi:predicted amidohydrolase YtcJ